jgi:hypothetical protein
MKEDSGPMHIRTTPRIESALLVVNRASGNGRTTEDIERLQSAFHDCFDPIANKVFEVTEGHGEVVHLTQDFLASFRGPCFLLSGGGGGTNRAVVQGLLKEAEKGTICLDDVQISSLRLGSGNLIPKYFGLPQEPLEGIRIIADDLFAGRTYPCCVYRCTFHYPSGETKQEYGLTMGGLGQFARVPDDIKRWKDKHLRLMKWASRLVPLETINTWQYVAFSMVRAMRCIVQPKQAELVEVRYANRSERFRLLAGMLLNFDFPQLPIQGGGDIGEPRLVLCLIPHKGRRHIIWTLFNWRNLNHRVRKYEINSEMPIEILFSENSSTTLALDEDTFNAPARIRFEVAEPVRFVTGTSFGYRESIYEPLRQHHWN